MLRIAIIFYCCVVSITAQGQILPHLSGDQLKEEIGVEFRPSTSLSYFDARDSLFSEIDNVDGIVRLVYTGDLFPTVSIPNHTIVNTEHTWAQSKFSDNRGERTMKTDMHHLFPVRAPVNSARGNSAFGEIPDAQTAKWWGAGGASQTAIPSSGINAFSESMNSVFEPREDHKGNVARAMFYFRTVYDDRDIDKHWFAGQLVTLLQWHAEDPVDDVERTRSTAIAALQGNENPFVLDETLAGRVFGSSITPNSVHPLEFARPETLDERSEPVRIVTWNIREIFSTNEVRNRRRALAEFAEDLRPDILILQEVTSYAQVQEIRNRMGLTGYYTACSDFIQNDGIQSRSFEVAIISRFPLTTVSENDPDPDNSNRPEEPREFPMRRVNLPGISQDVSMSRGFLRVRIEDLNLIVNLVHLKSSNGDRGWNDQRNAQKREVVAAAIVDQAGRDAVRYPDYSILVAGDFNIGETDQRKLGSELTSDCYDEDCSNDRYDETHAIFSQGITGQPSMRSLTRDLGLETYYDQRNRFEGTGPIDCIYVAGRNAGLFSAAQRGMSRFGSDHYPVWTVLWRESRRDESDVVDGRDEVRESGALITSSGSSRFGSFSGRVVSEWETHPGPDRIMKLTEDFRFLDSKGVRWVAKSGSKVNGASIPSAFWNLYVGPPYVGDYRRASVVHDVACVERKRSHHEVHRMFYEACRADGISKGKAQIMYAAVRTFGPKWEVDGSLTPQSLSDEERENFENRLNILIEEIEEDPLETFEKLETRLNFELGDPRASDTSSTLMPQKGKVDTSLVNAFQTRLSQGLKLKLGELSEVGGGGPGNVITNNNETVGAGGFSERVSVYTRKDVDVSQLGQSLKAQGIDVEGVAKAARQISLSNVSSDDLVELLRLPGVSFVDGSYKPRIGGERIITNNLDARDTHQVDEASVIHQVTGKGVKVGVWDGGKTRTTHREFDTPSGSRAKQVDFGSNLSFHATHVSGTIGAEGRFNENVKGMAPEVNLLCHDWNSDTSEMEAAAANGLAISNHSYGFTRGWDVERFRLPNGTTEEEYRWFGPEDPTQLEDPLFGKYISVSAAFDAVAEANTELSIFVAAGNDRNDPAPPPGTPYFLWNTSSQKFSARHPDGFDNGGFDTLEGTGVAKNVITIGAIHDIIGLEPQPSDVVVTNFSSWGPTDDGRIKPDLVANGHTLESLSSASDSATGDSSGTSMATPAAAGIGALIVQKWKKLHGNDSLPRSDVMKAILIHTAMSPNLGPSYTMGWGSIRADRALNLVAGAGGRIIESSVAGSGRKAWAGVSNGSGPIRVTLTWIDPEGDVNSQGLDDRTAVLKNNLDISLEGPDGEIFFPWSLNPDLPMVPATSVGPNVVDNVERIDINQADAPAGEWKVVVRGGAEFQKFALTISGLQDVSAE